MKIIKPTPTCPEDEAYIAYIDEHRKNVYTAFMRFGKMICLSLSLVQGEYDILRRRIYYHDASKYTDKEFAGYRQWFYPKEGEEKNKELFTEAWHHHYSTNSHHWEFYVENKEPRAMKKMDVAEMVLDWTAMSMKFKNNPIAWYNQNKSNIYIHRITRDQVEKTLSLLSISHLYPFQIRQKQKHKNYKKK